MVKNIKRMEELINEKYLSSLRLKDFDKLFENLLHYIDELEKYYTGALENCGKFRNSIQSIK